jgi:hypothetical protein
LMGKDSSSRGRCALLRTEWIDRSGDGSAAASLWGTVFSDQGTHIPISRSFGSIFVVMIGKECTSAIKVTNYKRKL